MKESVIKSVTLEKAIRTLCPTFTGQKEYLLSIEATVDFELWFDECEDWIMPKCECEYSDDSNQMHFWMDDFMNVHWLVRIPTRHIQYKVVDISRKIQELANEKYAEHLYDLELDNSKF